MGQGNLGICKGGGEGIHTGDQTGMACHRQAEQGGHPWGMGGPQEEGEEKGIHNHNLGVGDGGGHELSQREQAEEGVHVGGGMVMKTRDWLHAEALMK